MSGNFLEIFNQAVEIADPAKRAEYLARVCGGDAVLRAEVEELLATHNEMGEDNNFLSGVEKEPGERVGRYQLLQKLGEGGWGIVYLAEQEAPVRRRVALKIIKPGMDTRQVIARFEAERQALAMMDHPNIARVLDGGATESGRPYFVMELVQGIPITDYCDRNRLTTSARLELFLLVCQAVQHAHQKGIIHRDLKPSNILVSTESGRGIPKVIDFGVAKATTDVRLTDKTLVTRMGMFIGTPAYMSPEQADFSEGGIDTRTDIYALGILLYELLTGRPPFDGEQLLRQGIDALRHTICQTDPARPSTRLRELSESEQSSIAAARGTELPRLVTLIRGDLDWIVLKALEKDRGRRYESAGALAADLRRHLDDEPVDARPPSSWDGIQKLVRRNRTFFFSAFAAGLALVIGLGIATVLFFRERDARQRAVKAERTQTQLRQDADGARELAQAKTEEARRQLVLLNVSSGNKLEADGDDHRALLWFIEAMRLEQGDAARENIHRRRIAAILRSTPSLLHIGFLDSPVYRAEFTADGERVVALADAWQGYVWNVVSGETLAERVPYSVDLLMDARFPHKESVRNDGVPESRPAPLPLLIPVSKEPGLIVRDMASGVEIRSFSCGTNSIREGILSPNGRRAVGVGLNDTVYRWEAPGIEPIEPFLGRVPNLSRITFSADGSIFAGARGPISGEDIVVWDFSSGKQLLVLSKPAGHIYDCKLSPDGKLLAIASWDRFARVYNVATGAPVGNQIDHARGVSQSIFSPDGERLATSSWDGTARLWSPKTGRPLSPWLHHAGYVPHASFSPDGTRLLTAGNDETVRVWDVATNQSARLVLARRTNLVFASLDPAGTRLMLAGRDGSIEIRSLATGDLLASNRVAVLPARTAFDAVGGRLAVGCTNGEVRMLDAKSCADVISFSAHTGTIHSLEFSKDGKRLLTAGSNGAAVWDPADARQLTPMLTHTGGITHAEISPDGMSIVTAGNDHIAQVWDAATGAPVGKPMRHSCEVFWASFSPDGKRVVTAASDTTQFAREAQLWDSETGGPIGPALRHRDGVLFADFSPDGKWVVTASEDTSAVIWDAATGLAITPPLRHGSYVLGAAFSPDGRLLLTVSADKTARVWDALSGEPVTPPLIHDDQVKAGEWTPDGNQVMTFSADGIMRLWDVSPAKAPFADLQREAELLSAHRLQLGLGMTPLTKAEMQERWKIFQRAR